MSTFVCVYVCAYVCVYVHANVVCIYMCVYTCDDDDCFYYHSWRNNVVIAFGTLSSLCVYTKYVCVCVCMSAPLACVYICACMPA